MKEKSLFEKKFKILYTLALSLSLPLIIISLIINTTKFYFLTIFLTIIISVVSLLYFSFINLKFKQTINQHQYFLYVLAISISIPTFLPFDFGSRILQAVIIVFLLSLYGRYKLNLNIKEGKIIFAKRVAYLNMAVVLVLFYILLQLFLKYKGLYL